MALNKPAMKRVFSLAVQARSYSAPAERTIPAAKQKYVPTSGTYPKGFLAGSSHAGVKASNTQYDDIAVVASEEPCAAAGVFTRNLFQAAPVSASKRTLRNRADKAFRGVVVNSGCANAVTGAAGLEDADKMTRTLDGCFGDASDSDQAARSLVMSTGVIGQKLPIQKITDAIPKAHASLGSEHENWMRAARAICTTDTFPKLLSRTFTLPSQPDVQYSIAGMTKGAGMIHPNMGTLLGIICTDAKIAPDTMAPLLRIANTKSFNSITIDGDTSTNDTVLLFANGAAAPPETQPLQHYGERITSQSASADVLAFRDVLTDFMTDLAKLVVRDGEGATKFVTVRVRSTLDARDAKSAANSIATSSLVKTALYGKDANWGRILCAIGYAPGVMYGTQPNVEDPDQRRRIGSKLRRLPHQTSVSFVPTDGSEPLKLLVRGEPQAVDEERAKQILDMEDLEILVDMYDVDQAVSDRELQSRTVRDVTVWTCDFSHEYVTINGDYRT